MRHAEPHPGALRHDDGVPASDLPAARAWQRMLSGRRLDLLAPDPADIELDDMAHGLARVARWNGQTRGEHVFSVAQHSIFVEAIVSELAPDLGGPGRLAALLHDGPEYVIGDIITPLKSVIGSRYGAVEAGLGEAILRRFAVPEPDDGLRALIKRADRIAASCEATELAGFSSEEAREFFGAPEIAPTCREACLRPWPTHRAAMAFRRRAIELGAAATEPAR